MRILVVADIHYALKQYDWLLAVAEDYDAVFIAGDLLEDSSAVSLNAQVVVVRSYLERIAKLTKVMVCSGNSDLTQTDASGERVAHWIPALSGIGVVPDGQSVHLDDTLVSVLPWWDGRNTRGAIAAQLAADAEKTRKAWIWVHHAPPAGSPVAWSGARFHGDSNLLEWIGAYAPNIVFSGHVHQAPFLPDGAWVDRIGKTLVFNMGQETGDAPAHIVYDSEAHEAAWFTATMIENTGLAGMPAPVPGLPGWIRGGDRPS